MRTIGVTACFSFDPTTGQLRDHGPVFVEKYGFDPDRCTLTEDDGGFLTVEQEGRGQVRFMGIFWVHASLVPGADPRETPSS